MARPKHEHPTPAELEVLKILWERGPSTVRDVMDALAGQGHRRAYTSVMSLMNVMSDKGLLKRTPQGRAFVYAPRAGREKTLGRIVGELWQRAFEGSASTLVSRLLDEASPSREELDQIRRAIEEYQRQQENQR
jgi:predicted transcriptional regulator